MELDGTGISQINESACFQDKLIKKSGLEVLNCGNKRELGTPFSADCGTMRGENEICCCYSNYSTALFRPTLSAAELVSCALLFVSTMLSKYCIDLIFTS